MTVILLAAGLFTGIVSSQLDGLDICRDEGGCVLEKDLIVCNPKKAGSTTESIADGVRVYIGEPDYEGLLFLVNACEVWESGTSIRVFSAEDDPSLGPDAKVLAQHFVFLLNMDQPDLAFAFRDWIKVRR